MAGKRSIPSAGGKAKSGRVGRALKREYEKYKGDVAAGKRANSVGGGSGSPTANRKSPPPRRGPRAV